MKRPARLVPVPLVGCLLALLVSGCESPAEAPTVDAAVQFAKGGGPSVESTSPSEGEQGSVNLLVTVTGSGFDEGSVASWLLDGASTADVTTNNTTFVSREELVADITISEGALESLYDVEVTTSRGKKGVGVELFSVKKKGEVTPSYQVSTFNNPDARIMDVSDTDVLAGSANDVPVLFDLSGGETLLPHFGNGGGVRKLGPTAQFAVGWDWDGTLERGMIWTLQSSSATVARPESLPDYPLADWENELHDVNDSGVVVGQVVERNPESGRSPATVWHPDGSQRWIPELLPLLPNFTRSSALAVNDHGDIVGRNQTDAFGSGHAVLWSRNDDGTYDILDLSPGADGTGDVLAWTISERAIDGTILVGGYSTYADDSRATIWTVDAVNRVMLDERRGAGSGRVRDFGPTGDVLVNGDRVWDTSRDMFITIDATGEQCRVRGNAFGSSGELYGWGDVNTKNGTGCSQGSRFVAEVALVWTKTGA